MFRDGELPFATQGARSSLPALKSAVPFARLPGRAATLASPAISASRLDLSSQRTLTPSDRQLKHNQSSHSALTLASSAAFSLPPASASMRRTCPGFGRSATCGQFIAHTLEARDSVRNISTPLLALKPESAVGAERSPGSAASPHEALQLRLKSGVVRREADSNRRFLDVYRRAGGSNTKSDADLNVIIARTSDRADELEESSARLKTEDEELSRKIERSALAFRQLHRATEEELHDMTVVERQVVRVTEDKRAEELKRQADDCKAAYSRTKRKLSTELSEMRDYRVYLLECRTLRLEKIQESLSVAGDNKVRALVREMIKHKALKVLQRLEQGVKWLEPWMREVLVNSCHIENRIEDAEVRLMNLRKQVLQPFHSDLRSLSESTKQERVAALSSPRAAGKGDGKSVPAQAEVPPTAALAAESVPPVPPTLSQKDERVAPSLRRRKCVRMPAAALQPNTLPILEEESEFPNDSSPQAHPEWPPREAHRQARGRVPGDVAGKIEAAVAERDSLRKLLLDMRHNAAAAVCHRVREADRGAGGCCGDAREWGVSALAVLVSEDFAKETMKAMQKSSSGPKRLTA